MFTKKSILALLMAGLLSVTLVACGSNAGESTGYDQASPETAEVAAETVDSAQASAQASGLSLREEGGSAYGEQASSFSPTPAPPADSAPQSPSYAASAAPAAASAPAPTAAPEAMGAVVPVEVEKEVVVETEVVVEAQAEATGQASAAGPQGPAGPQGAAGRAGQAGPQGSAGPAGPAGHRGTAATPAPQANSLGNSGQSQPAATTFQDNPRRPTVSTYEDAVSTFSLDTDRTSYRLALNWARQGYDVEPDSVRAEEWINSFNYDYAGPSDDGEFAIHTDVFRHPLDNGKHLARVAFQAPYVSDDSVPLNVTLVMDASGSMAEGNRVDIARAAADAIRQSLRPQDRITVVHFSEDVISGLTVSHSRPDDRDVRNSINRLRPGGATNVQAGLNLGVELAEEARWSRPDAVNYIILMSDGVANVDATSPFAILETAADHSDRNPLRLITIGVGIENYNDLLLEQLAQYGNGWYRYLDNVHQAQETFSRENWLNLALPFADQTRAQVTWDPAMVSSWRIVGYENRVTSAESFTQNRKEFAEIPSGAATTVFYELQLTGQLESRNANTARLGDVELRWVEPRTGASREQYGAVSGHWRQSFDAVGDPLLQLGALVALSADRYSSLPHSAYAGYGNVNWEMQELLRRLYNLQDSLGNLAAYSDFMLLLETMMRYVPPAPQASGDSGYSP